MFVVFEGIDGSGKTTVSNQVAEALRARGLSVTHVRENGKFVSAVSEAIRELGRDAKNLELEPQAEFSLYVARDVQLIEQALRPALRKSDVVLADRFLYTAEVLARAGRHLPEEATAPVLQAAANGLEPDLVILVDVDPTLARARRKSSKLQARDQRPPARKGLSGVGLQHRLRRGYLDRAAQSPDRWLVVDNSEVLSDLVARLVDLIDEAQGGSTPEALTRFRLATPRADDRAAVSLESPAAALESFLGWLDLRSVREPRVSAYLLSGLFGPRVDERRRSLAERVPEAILAGCAGLVDDTSWELRSLFANTYPAAVARSLLGIAPSSIAPSEGRAAALREALEPVAPREVAESLYALDDERAWQLRERLYARAPHEVAGSLATLNSERARLMRDAWLGDLAAGFGDAYERARIACRSITGLEDDRAWLVRDAALCGSAGGGPRFGLGGIGDEELAASRTLFAPRAQNRDVDASCRHRSARLGHAQPSGR